VSSEASRWLAQRRCRSS